MNRRRGGWPLWAKVLLGALLALALAGIFLAATGALGPPQTPYPAATPIPPKTATQRIVTPIQPSPTQPGVEAGMTPRATSAEGTPGAIVPMNTTTPSVAPVPTKVSSPTEEPEVIPPGEQGPQETPFPYPLESPTPTETPISGGGVEAGF